MFKDKKHKAKQSEKVAKQLGVPIVDECPCGAKVAKYERQELVFNRNTEKWNRMCSECVTRDRTFSSTEAIAVNANNHAI